MSNLWKVIYVASRTEKKVGERLSKIGVECFIPLKKEVRQWSDRKKTVVSPMISGYVFVRPSAIQRDKVLQQAGVLNYVRYNGSDASVRDSEIAALKSIEEKGYHVEGEFVGAYKQGDKVKIAYGPFKGLYGSIHKVGNRNIHSILIEGISYQLRVNLPQEVVIKKEG